MHSNLVWGYWLLVELPVWVIATLFMFLSVGILHIGRLKLEGIPYNVALSSEVGDLFLVGVITIAATAIQRNPSGLPELLAGRHELHLAIMAVAYGVGVYLLVTKWTTPSGTEGMDRYHHVFVLPTLAYFVAISFLALLFSGRWYELFIAVVFVGVWAYLFNFDDKHGLLDQRPYLEQRGIVWPERN